MLRRLNELEHYSLVAADGEVGTVVDFLVADDLWTIRYLVATANATAGAREVLIAPASFRRADRQTRRFHVALTADEVRAAPGLDTNQPVSAQHEIEHHRYFGHPRYWGGSGTWGVGANPAVQGDGRQGDGREARDSADGVAEGDPHLRSAGEMRDYLVDGCDAPIGRIADFVVDDATWEVRYLVVDAGSWWPGAMILLEPSWALRLSWKEGMIHFDLSRLAVRHSPPWTNSETVERRYEAQLRDYYGHPANGNRGDRQEEAAPLRRAPGGGS